MKRLLYLILAATVIVPGLILHRADAVTHNRTVSETVTHCVSLDVGTFGDGTGRQVYDVRPGPSAVYAAGKFDGPRHNLAAFTPNCALTGFAPAVDGTVYAVLPEADGWVTIAGGFKHVNGTAQAGLAQVNATTGALNPAFRPTITGGVVRTVQHTHGVYIVGGNFTSIGGRTQAALGTVDDTTGAYTPYLDDTITGHLHATNEPAGRPNMLTSTLRGNDRLAVVFDAKRVNGAERRQVAVWNLGTSATLAGWDPQILHRPDCGGDERLVVQDVAYSPDGTRLTTAATGGPKPGVCDAVTAFDAGSGERLWTNETCNDSLYAVEDTGAAVYAQGHQKCHEPTPATLVDNSKADGDNPLFVDRNGIAAINPANGNLLGWRSDQPRCLGGRGLTASPAGLWGGLDCPFAGSPITFRALS